MGFIDCAVNGLLGNIRREIRGSGYGIVALVRTRQGHGKAHSLIAARILVSLAVGIYEDRIADGCSQVIIGHYIIAKAIQCHICIRIAIINLIFCFIACAVNGLLLNGEYRLVGHGRVAVLPLHHIVAQLVGGEVCGVFTCVLAGLLACIRKVRGGAAILGVV